MKKLFYLVVCFVWIACHTAKKTIVINPGNKVIENGLALIAKQDCTTCHSVETRLVGPSFNQISQKYTLNQKTINTLAKKIIRGGTGVWGKIPMLPHPDLNPDSAKIIVLAILALHKN